jgi:hypothetical protein
MTVDQTDLLKRIQSLEARVIHLTHREEIAEMYWRYTRGLNRHDMELLRSAFWPDGQVNYGSNSWASHEWTVSWERNFLRGLASQAHHLTNMTMDINGDIAHVESYLIALRRTPDEQSTIFGCGRYIDRVDRRDGVWRIAVREFVPHCWIEAKSVLGSYFPQSAIDMGTYDRTDPSYRRPLTSRPPATEALPHAK